MTFARVLDRQVRREGRLGSLAAARALIHAERQRGPHDVLVRATMEDPLTGLGNRRALDHRLQDERKRLRDEGAIAMVLIDIDQFKGVNDWLCARARPARETFGV